MNRSVSILTLGVIAAMVLPAGVARAAGAAGRGAVLAPIKRAEALQLAERVLTPRTSAWKTAGSAVIDPFFRANNEPEEKKPVEVDPASLAPARSDLEILEIAATSHIKPTGIMKVDGENYLLVGGKRHKTGAQLTVTIDGAAYVITISAIEGNTYTLRLNEHVLQRKQ